MLPRFLIITFILLLQSAFNFAQTDWVKWGAKEVSYTIDDYVRPENTAVNQTFTLTVVSFFRNLYGLFISDLDGDNCPFYPSCSNFFVQSVEEAGLIKGSLMFFDRFLRDLNLLKGKNHYPLYTTGKFYDPPYNYTLSQEKIIYQIPGKVID